MISTSKIPLPLLIDDEYLSETEEGEQPPDKLSYMGLFVYSIKLLDILEEILSTFYSQQDSLNDSPYVNFQEKFRQEMHNILRLNSKLDAFVNTLPEYLCNHTHSEGGGDQAKSSVLEAKVLQAR